jgi:hypothetical protein
MKSLRAIQQHLRDKFTPPILFEFQLLLALFSFHLTYIAAIEARASTKAFGMYENKSS